MQKTQVTWPFLAADHLDAVRAFNEKLVDVDSGADRTEAFCDFRSVDARGLSWQDFQARGLAEQPVLLRGLHNISLKDGGPPGDPWADSPLRNRTGFLSAYGEAPASVGNGRNDGWRSVFHGARVREYLDWGASASASFLIMDNPLARHIWDAVGGSQPFRAPLLEDFTERPIVSLGVEASGEGMHTHEQTWLSLLAGRKAWWISQPFDLHAATNFGFTDACRHLPLLEEDEVAGPHDGDDDRRRGGSGVAQQKQHAGLAFCVQRAGETVYFPKGAYHATCNLAGFNIGVGSQGRIGEWPELLRAVSKGHVSTVEQLLAGGGEGGGANNKVLRTQNAAGQTALHRAAFDRGGSLCMAELLLSHGADPNAAAMV